MKTIANVGGFIKSDDEFFTPCDPIIDLISRIKLDTNKVIWCPFDTKESEFVKQLTLFGYKVINSHIELGQDFFDFIPNEPWDIIISNPPFKNKKRFIERAIELGKDYILLFGSAVAFQNGFANILNDHEIYYIYQPIKFKSLNGKDKRFLCLWLQNK